MDKCNALLYAMVIGFGLAAGVRVYIAWESLINLAWSAIRAQIPSRTQSRAVNDVEQWHL
ncbi:TPA: hypothetical protein QHU85_002426 [Klebsiella aerogenes]|nr:hypothetical protein [Klebsiella aerogenes]